ncbi:MAG: alpha/beta hydrolase [Lachnospiraceae bacterium]|nr:alpha/beta hydrolase [Lachnospiraceae bacterium]
MLSKEAQYMNQMFQSFPADPPGKRHDYAAERAANALRPFPPTPEGVRIEEIKNGEIIVPDEPNGKYILYIHGGGMTTGSAKERRDITFYLADIYKYTVYANNYRLSPENKWPAQMEDCLAFYEDMLNSGIAPERLFFMGESAGGTLVLSTALVARDAGKPLPAGIAAFSPATTQGDEFPSRRGNIPTEYMLKDALTRPDQLIALTGTEKPEERLMKDPYFSPYYAEYDQMPPIFLSASDAEVLYDDSVKLYEKLKKEGRPAELEVLHDMIHAYPIFPMIPEARETIEKAVKYLEYSQP